MGDFPTSEYPTGGDCYSRKSSTEDHDMVSITYSASNKNSYGIARRRLSNTPKF